MTDIVVPRDLVKLIASFLDVSQTQSHYFLEIFICESRNQGAKIAAFFSNKNIEIKKNCSFTNP